MGWGTGVKTLLKQQFFAGLPSQPSPAVDEGQWRSLRVDGTSYPAREMTKAASEPEAQKKVFLQAKEQLIVIIITLSAS